MTVAATRTLQTGLPARSHPMRVIPASVSSPGKWADDHLPTFRTVTRVKRGTGCELASCTVENCGPDWDGAQTIKDTVLEQSTDSHGLTQPGLAGGASPECGDVAASSPHGPICAARGERVCRILASGEGTWAQVGPLPGTLCAWASSVKTQTRD